MAEGKETRDWDRVVAIITPWAGKAAASVHPFRKHKRATPDTKLGPKESVQLLASVFGTGPKAVKVEPHGRKRISS